MTKQLLPAGKWIMLPVNLQLLVKAHVRDLFDEPLFFMTVTGCTAVHGRETKLYSGISIEKYVVSSKQVNRFDKPVHCKRVLQL